MGLDEQDEHGFSPFMLTSDPRICNLLQNVQLTPFPVDALLLKRCTQRETELMEYAGHELAMPVVSRIGRVRNDTTFHQEAALMKRGTPLEPANVRLEDCKSVSLQVTELVSRLHAKGIVHGDINPSALQWDCEERLVFVDFRNSRRLGGEGGSCWDGNGEFVSPWLTANTRPGRCFVPGQPDDLYAMAVTIWCIWAGRYPDQGMFSGNVDAAPDLQVITDPEIFGIVVDALQQGGLNLDVAAHQPVLEGSEPSQGSPLSEWTDGETFPSGSPPNMSNNRHIAPARRRRARRYRRPPIELPDAVPIASPPAQEAKLFKVPPPVILTKQSPPYPSSPTDTLPLSSKFSPNLTLSTNFPLQTRSSTPSTPSSLSSDVSDQDDDDLDEEITWEFPFPFMQGLPCSPTDSLACLASPKGPPPPDFAVRVSPEQLRIQHPRVQSMISMSEELERFDSLDRVGEVGRRWCAVSRARATRSLSRGLDGSFSGGLLRSSSGEVGVAGERRSWDQ
ncbi:hypothetical protein OQA88_8394 [Cercophora sp. LCS_1]